MKYLLLVFTLLVSITLVNAQTASSKNPYLGIWKNLDDEDGQEKSHIKVYMDKNELKAQVIKLLPAATLKTCDKCKGVNKGKSIEGMLLLTGMKKQKDGSYSDGEILNPKNGKLYSCTVSMDGNDKMKVRGYLGFSMIGKTQYWYRVE